MCWKALRHWSRCGNQLHQRYRRKIFWCWWLCWWIDDSEEDFDIIHADITKLFGAWNGAYWDTKSSLKRKFFSWHEYKMDKKEFLKFDDVEIEKLRVHSSESAIPIDDLIIN